MPKFYFTYGTAHHYPYKGGWTEIEAPDFQTAIAVFRLAHPDEDKGILHCAFSYTEEAFKATDMYTKNDNCGHGVWEKLKLIQEVFE